jgi:hypothetical protein
MSEPAQFLTVTPSLTTNTTAKLLVDSANRLIVNVTAGTITVTGVATAANQVTEITALEAISDQLPAALGPQTAATSLSVTRPSRVPRVEHLASAALPAAGAFTSQSAYSIPSGAQFVTCWVSYTRGAVGGYAKLRALLGNGTEEGIAPVVDPTITASQPYGQTPIYPNELIGPQPQDGSAVIWLVTFDVRGGATTFRLLAAELGVTGTPGTCAIALTAGH